MLSGIKFIPRDRIDSSLGHVVSDSDSFPRERRKLQGKKKRGGKKSRKKSHRYSSEEDGDNDGIERSKGKSSSIERNKRKVSYRSDDDDSFSQSTDESHSDSEELMRRKKHSNKRRDYSSSDNDVFSSDGDKNHIRRRNHRKDKRKKINDDGDDVSLKDKELVRKQMGLEWMFKPGDAMERRPVELNETNEKSALKEMKRANPRELNPYLKDDGTGFPDDASQTMSNSNALLSSSVVGDGGASWRLKALKRAEEQAVREGRKLNEVVEERWGSLGHLAGSVTSHKAAHTHAHLHAIKDRRRVTENFETTPGDRMKGAEIHRGRQDYLHDVSSRHPEMRKPKHDAYAWKKKKTDSKCSEENLVISNALCKLNRFTNDGSFMDEVIHQQSGASSSSCMEMESECKAAVVPLKTIADGKEDLAVMQGLNANQLAAKALQLRLKGKHEEAEKLLKAVESMTDDHDPKAKVVNLEAQRNTDRYFGRRMPSELKKKEEDADLHLAHKIIQNRRYTVSAQADDEYDFDDIPNRKRNKKKEVVADEKRNLSKGILIQQERCQFCFENSSRPKHLVISIANFTYMALPQWQPVVEGHCCILPLQHEASTRTVDDNVWEEIRNFKKCLIMMFAKQDKVVVFLETVIGLSKQRRHCLVECIPLPCDLANEAPLYFKKAIDEAEDEWSQHNAKRLIETTAEKGLRRSIPKDFPYFHVEFGLDKGFVHVIEDETKFESGLGLNVIRGMLRLPEEDMYRRRRCEAIEKQKTAVATFAQEWEPFDWTKQLS